MHLQCHLKGENGAASAIGCTAATDFGNSKSKQFASSGRSFKERLNRFVGILAKKITKRNLEEQWQNLILTRVRKI